MKPCKGMAVDVLFVYLPLERAYRRWKSVYKIGP